MDTVKEMDRRVLGEQFGTPTEALDWIRQTAVEENVLHGGHSQATVVVELKRTRVVWIVRGYDQDVFRCFSTALQPARGAGDCSGRHL